MIDGIGTKVLDSDCEKNAELHLATYVTLDTRCPVDINPFGDMVANPFTVETRFNGRDPIVGVILEKRAYSIAKLFTVERRDGVEM